MTNRKWWFLDKVVFRLSDCNRKKPGERSWASVTPCTHGTVRPGGGVRGGGTRGNGVRVGGADPGGTQWYGSGPSLSSFYRVFTEFFGIFPFSGILLNFRDFPIFRVSSGV